MAIVGFNFSKINVERKKDPVGKVDINNNVSVKNVEEADFAVGSLKQKGLRFTFEFVSDYTPDIASITLNGSVLFVGDKSQTEKILGEWKKNKKLSKDIMADIVNTVLTRCNVESVMLSRDVNLPPPIPMPTVKKED